MANAGAIRANPTDELEYAWVPAGTFQMGCVPDDTECDEDEKPRHAVTLSVGFWMGRTEVTVAAYEKFAAASSLLDLVDLADKREEAKRGDGDFHGTSYSSNTVMVVSAKSLLPSTVASTVPNVIL